jgi:peptidoglycan/LPS O-acetylase OafA/YrhL
MARQSSAHPYAYSERVPDPAAPRPAPLLLAAVLLGLEALAALVFGGIALTQIRIDRAVVGTEVAIWMLGYGLLLVALARAVFLGRRWSRAPSIATQLILLPIAFSFRGEPTTWVAATIALVAIAALVALLHPRSTEVFVGPAKPAR